MPLQLEAFFRVGILTLDSRGVKRGRGTQWRCRDTGSQA